MKMRQEMQICLQQVSKIMRLLLLLYDIWCRGREIEEWAGSKWIDSVRQAQFRAEFGIESDLIIIVEFKAMYGISLPQTN
jgi:hypothetical protein